MLRKERKLKRRQTAKYTTEQLRDILCSIDANIHADDVLKHWNLIDTEEKDTE